MIAVGGYLGLDINNSGSQYHHTCLALKSGRASLNMILKYTTPAKVYLPYYCCDTLLEPIVQNKIPFEFYEINHQLEPTVLPVIDDKTLFIYINYFGIKDRYCDHLTSHLGDRLVLDCTQAFFYRGNGKSWVFNSSRKFFGVPDGSYLYTPAVYSSLLDIQLKENTTYVTQHLTYGAEGKVEEGYEYFLENEKLIDSEIQGMSLLTRCLLGQINFEKVMKVRKSNFRFYHQRLNEDNRLSLKIVGQIVPFCYPFLPDKQLDLENFTSERIYIPRYWKDCLDRPNLSEGFRFSCSLASTLAPLPLDQRYRHRDLKRILDLIRYRNEE